MSHTEIRKVAKRRAEVAWRLWYWSASQSPSVLTLSAEAAVQQHRRLQGLWYRFLDLKALAERLGETVEVGA